MRKKFSEFSMKFEKIYIELSDICGLRCDFCPAKKGVRGKMSVDEFEKIAMKVAKFGRIFTFHVLGDALKMSNLSEFIAVAKAYKMPLELSTSGFYLDDEIQEILLKSENIRQINFSIMAFLAQKSVKFEAYFTPILNLLKAHQITQNRGFVNLRLWNLDKNLNPPKENEKIYSLLEDEFGVKIPRKVLKFRLARHIFLHQNAKFKWASLKHKKHTQGRCHGLLRQIAILSNGVVVPCCMDARGDINLGDIFTQDLSWILNSPRAIKMREGFLQNKLVEKLCQGCEFGISRTLT